MNDPEAAIIRLLTNTYDERLDGFHRLAESPSGCEGCEDLGGTKGLEGCEDLED